MRVDWLSEVGFLAFKGQVRWNLDTYASHSYRSAKIKLGLALLWLSSALYHPILEQARVTFLSHLPEYVTEVIDWSGRAELDTKNSLDRVVCREVDCDPLTRPLLLITGIQAGEFYILQSTPSFQIKPYPSKLPCTKGATPSVCFKLFCHYYHNHDNNTNGHPP